MYENSLIYGDNLQVLSNLPDNYVDLIYLDPPFNSKRNYIVVGDPKSDTGRAQVAYFKDVWHSYDTYTEFLKVRLEQMNRILKPTGSLYLHCDPTMSHYIKVMMDKVFGIKNYRNEVIWSYRTGGVSKKKWPKKHDVIFLYSKSDNFNFNPQKERIDYEKNFFGAKKDANGFYSNVYIRDTWNIPAVINVSKERVGYPTQKPLALLGRIIKASSNEGDLVLDPFMGSGTTVEAAVRNKRNFIGIDMHPIAMEKTKERLDKIKVKYTQITSYDILGKEKEKNIKKYNRITDISTWESMDPFEFQNRMAYMVGGYPNPKKIGDMGIDGWTENGIIQVKRSKGVGRPVIDNLYATMIREGKLYGIVIALSFTSGAIEAIKTWSKHGVKIDLFTLSDVLSGTIAKESENLKFRLVMENNKIKVVDLNQKIIQYSWWINKDDKDVFFEGIELNKKPITTNKSNDFILKNHKDKFKVGKINKINCLAYNENGKTKEVEINVLITKKMLK